MVGDNQHLQITTNSRIICKWNRLFKKTVFQSYVPLHFGEKSLMHISDLPAALRHKNFFFEGFKGFPVRSDMFMRSLLCRDGKMKTKTTPQIISSRWQHHYVICSLSEIKGMNSLSIINKYKYIWRNTFLSD